ncbi:hypothetical protein KXX35_009988 [Aspergillus fumigatus]|nr:hypothetical protein KXX35_009988 [Aspergillus fumigatus]
MVQVIPLDLDEVATPEGRVFGEFFANVVTCLVLMEATKTIASGSSVLSALVQDFGWVFNDLDLFVQYDHASDMGSLPWFNFLTEQEGYHLVERSGYTGRYGARYYTYRNYDRDTVVRVVVSRYDPVQYIMGSSWGTHLMNFATWNGIYCLFPEATLSGRMVVLDGFEDVAQSSYEAFVGRGFSRVEVGQVRELAEFKSERMVFDEVTRMVPFLFGSYSVEPVGQFSFSIVDGGVRFGRGVRLYPEPFRQSDAVGFFLNNMEYVGVY